MTHSPRPRLLHWLLLGSLVAMWGSSFLVTEIGLHTLSPATVVASRVWLATAVLYGVLRATGKRLPSDATIWGWFVVMGIVGNVLPFMLIAWGQQGVDSGLAGISMSIMPITVIVLAHFFVPGERLNRNRAAGFAAGFLGVLLLLGPSSLEAAESGGPLAAKLAVLGGAMLYGINVIIARLGPSCDASVNATAVLLVASVLMVPIATVDAIPELIRASGPSLLAVTALGLLSTGLATVIYFQLVKTAGAGFLSLINYMIPVWAVLAGWLLLGERLPLTALVALCIILGGVWISQRPTGANQKPPTRAEPESVKP